MHVCALAFYSQCCLSAGCAANMADQVDEVLSSEDEQEEEEEAYNPPDHPDPIVQADINSTNPSPCSLDWQANMKVKMLQAISSTWPSIRRELTADHVGFDYRTLPGHIIVCIEIGHMCHDGQLGTCHHTCGQGVGPLVTLHGTKSAATAASIIEGGGRIWDAGPPPRSLARMKGFYHSEDFCISLQYAYPTQLGPFHVRLLFQIKAVCCNSCGKDRNWVYTKSGCLRYHVFRLYIVPTGAVPGYPIC